MTEAFATGGIANNNIPSNTTLRTAHSPVLGNFRSSQLRDHSPPSTHVIALSDGIAPKPA
jgi:hypothetical protein